MCDQRERLIEYVYDECDGPDRRAIEAHLSECHVCRTEIQGLRGVRQDLLAWDVPEVGSVFRPFAPTRVAPSWRDIPAWAMAAAAAVVFMAGAAGGAATRWLVAAPVAAVASATVPATTTAMAQPTTVTLSAAQIAEVKASVLRDVRAEVDQRLVSVMATHGAAAPAFQRAMQTRVAELEEWQRDQIDLNVELDRKLRLVSSRTNNVNSQLERNSQALLRAVSLQGQ